MILPKHVFEAYMGAKSRERPPTSSRWAPGPTSIVDFKPGDIDARPRANPMGYHVPNQPVLRLALELKGGGDATECGRAPCCRPASTTWPGTWPSKTSILKRLEAAGKGRMEF